MPPGEILALGGGDVYILAFLDRVWVGVGDKDVGLGEKKVTTHIEVPISTIYSRRCYIVRFQV